MNIHLEEKVTHGTPLFPFQLYNLAAATGKIVAPCHWHTEVEIIYVRAGRLTVTIDGRRHRAKKGDIFVVNSAQLHEIIGEDNALRYCALVFPLQLLSFEMHDFGQSRYLGPLCRGEAALATHMPAAHTQATQMHTCLEGIIALCAAQPPGYQLGVRAGLLQFVSLMIAGGMLAAQPIENNDAKQETLKSVLQYINHHSGEKLTLQRVAGAFNFSPKYFCHYFKANFGRSFVEYLHYIRLESAAELLLHTNMKVTAVAHQVGFDNLSYFIRCFKSRFGYTPAGYRKASPVLQQHHPVRQMP